MIRRLSLGLSLLILGVPFGAAAQRGGSTAPEELSSEAKVLLGTIGVVRDYALEALSDSALFELAIDGLIRELNDPYAKVLSPDEVNEFEEQSTGNYAGIGIAISQLNGAVTVTRVFRDTPAERAGMEVGDRIVGVGTEDGREWNEEDASSRIRGRPGTTVVVRVERDGYDEPMIHEMERAEVHIPAVTAERIFSNIGYINVERVARGSGTEVDSVLTIMADTLADTRGLVLDLRGNPGGYLDEALRMADLFLERGAVLARTHSRVRAGPGDMLDEAHYDRLAPRVPDLPIVVLVDRFSASAAEIVAGALQDHDRALVIGERTFGKGTVQSVIPLPEGRLIRITSGEWHTPQGRSLNRRRDADGALIEAVDSVPEYRSVGGRLLTGGGGVFPDLEITRDTLTTGEQAVPLAAAEAEIDLARRIQEAAFTAARRFRDAGEVPAGFPEADFQAFSRSLVDEGIPEAALNDEAVGYLRSVLEERMYSGLDDVRYLEVMAERDTVLATAVRLLSAAGEQEDLFTLAAAEQAAVAERVRVGAPGL